MQIKDWSIQDKKQETTTILNYLVYGILILIISRRYFARHNREFYETGIYEWRVRIMQSRSIEADGIVCGDDRLYELFTQMHVKVLRDGSWSSTDFVVNSSLAAY